MNTDEYGRSRLSTTAILIVPGRVLLSLGPFSTVIAGLDPAIHAWISLSRAAEEWIAGSSPVMTV